MKTKQRILQSSLELFNARGEPKVTTIDIASEMSISPGNLYYHYRNKGEIVESLFGDFESQLLEVLEAPVIEEFEWIDVWVFVSIVFDRLWEYRFIFLDTHSLLRRYDALANRFRRLQSKSQEEFYNLIQAYMREGQLVLSAEAQQTLVVQLSLSVQHWFAHYWQYVDQDPTGRDIKNHGVFQVLMLLAMHMSADQQQELLRLAHSEGVDT